MNKRWITIPLRIIVTAAITLLVGYFYEPHGEPEKFPEAAQEVLDDGSIRMTMQ